MNKRAAFHTLGCKVNQYDTEAMLESFERAGYEIVPFNSDADVYLINTCTVTGTGDQKSYKLMRRISKTEIVDGARDYRLMTRQFVDSLLALGEYNRFSKGLYGWVGYRTKWLEFENVARAAGETKWSFWKLLLYSIEGIVAFSAAPLAIAVVTGLACFLLALVFILFIVVRTLMFGDPVAGWPSLVCIILLIGGLQLLCIGILGEYLAKTYLEVKNRPIYICKETNTCENDR